MTINILFPMNKRSQYFSNEKFSFPQYLQEIGNEPILKKVVDNYIGIEGSRFTFILNKDDCEKYYTDNVTKLLTEDKCTNVILENETRGSICTCLMAIDSINNDNELIIANSDQVFKINLSDYVCRFREEGVEAAVIYFESIHPRWSFVKLDKDSNVVEAAEKKPISKNAIAGFYYFSKGMYFVDAAMAAIRRGLGVNGSYYVSLALNEMVLLNKSIKGYKIEQQDYITLYAPEKLDEYRNKI